MRVGELEKIAIGKKGTPEHKLSKALRMIISFFTKNIFELLCLLYRATLNLKIIGAWKDYLLL
jgi:hypothetical protein